MICQRSSVVEQLFRKEQVVGSIPTVGSTKLSYSSFDWKSKYIFKTQLDPDLDKLTLKPFDIPSAFND